MHCLFCGATKLRKHKRTGLYRCRAHGFVGPRPRLEAYRRGITETQWSVIWAAIVDARASTPLAQAAIERPFLEQFRHAAP